MAGESCVKKTTSRERDEILNALGRLLECAGPAMEWTALRGQLTKMNVRALHNLKYRIERALADAAQAYTSEG